MSLMLDECYFKDHNTSQELKEHFQTYCEWCWRHSYGNCDICHKIYNKLYIPLRKKELQIKLGLKTAKESEDKE